MKKIVIYSKTGNTQSVAEEMSKKYGIEILKIIPENDDPNIVNPILKVKPAIIPFEEIILGTPVHGFMPAKVMETYIKQTDFSHKKVQIFVTHFFPFAWMGGNTSLKKLKSWIEAQGGEVTDMVSINWKNRKRIQDIQSLVSRYDS